MAFGGGINPNTPVTVSTTAGGTVNRTNLTSPMVPATGGPTTTGTEGGRPVVRAVLPASAGIFGGTSTKTTKGEEVDERWHGDARRFGVFNPPINVAGPLVAPGREVGLPQPIERLPKAVTSLFLAALER